MADPQDNEFSTPELQIAAIVHAAGQHLRRIVFPPGSRQATFYFDPLPAELAQAMQSLNVPVNGYAVFASWNFLRDELEEARRKRAFDTNDGEGFVRGNHRRDS